MVVEVNREQNGNDTFFIVTLDGDNVGVYDTRNQAVSKANKLLQMIQEGRLVNDFEDFDVRR